MTERPPRRWFRYSLRTLLVAMAVLAVGLGWWVNSARQQKDAVGRLRSVCLYSWLYYDYQRRKGADPSIRFAYVDDAVSWVPSPILGLWGADFFHSVAVVGVSGANARQMGQALPLIGRLRSIKALHFRYCSTTSPEAFAELAHLRRLRELSIDGFRYTVGSTSFADDALRAIRKLTQLQILSVENARLTDEGLAYIGELKQLKSLVIRKATITDDGLASLAGLSNLEQLSLCETEITGQGFEYLQALTKLRELDLVGSPITDEGLSQVAGLTSLESLNLRSTHVTNAGRVHLKRLTKLQFDGLPQAIATEGVEKALDWWLKTNPLR